jgi:hypothetical protein
VGYLGSDGDPLERYPRIWLLSQPELPNAQHQQFRSRFTDRRTPEGAEWQLGTLRLQRFRNERYRPPLLSSDDAVLESTSATVSLGGTQEPCRREGERLLCPHGAFVQGPEWHEVHYRPLRCLWVHPPTSSATLHLALPDDPLPRRVRIEAGLFWEHAAKQGKELTPVEIAVVSSSGRLGALEILPGDETLHDFETELPSEGSRLLHLKIQTANPNSRELCLRWNLYGPP